MRQRLSDHFLIWLKEPDGKKILKTIAQYQELSLAMREDRIVVYFQGCKILTIKSQITKCITGNLIPLSKVYLTTEESQIKSIIDSGINSTNLQLYLDLVIGLLSRRNNIRQEDRIRQEIAQTNNRSREANDTDFFIVAQEYVATVNKVSKFDLVAIK